MFRNPPLPQISTFSLSQKGCAYYGKSAYYEWTQWKFSKHVLDDECPRNIKMGEDGQFPIFLLTSFPGSGNTYVAN